MSHPSISPNVFDDDRLADGQLLDFRCESCEGRYPFDLLVIEDGHKVCKPNCAHDTPLSERERLAAEAQLEATRLTTDNIERNTERLGRGNLYSLMDGVSVCTKLASGSTIYPVQIQLVSGGPSVSLALTGVGFSTSDVVTSSHSGITFSAGTISTDQLSWTLTVAASGLVPTGNYIFYFNGARFPDAFRVT